MKSIAVYLTLYLAIQVHGRMEEKLHATLTTVMEGDEC